MAKKPQKRRQGENRSTTRRNDGQYEPRPRKKLNDGIFVFTEPLTVGALADQLNLNASEIIKFLFLKGTMVTINTVLEEALMQRIVEEFDYKFVVEEVEEAALFDEYDFKDDEKDLWQKDYIY